MSERQETVDDIIAEKRRRAEEIERDCAEKMKRGEMVSDCYARELVADIRREADRLEAAHRRERGNSAALREALEAAELGLFWWQSGSMNRDKHRALIATIKAALAAPPRNCDIYFTEEAVGAATVTVRDCGACSRIDMEAPCVFCMVRWLLAPAQEKEGDAK